MSSIFSNPIVAMILMLGCLVFFHELGHFLVGRWCNIAVETFSIGFGAPIFSKKINDTTYQIGTLPLGGFVKFYGSTRNDDAPRELTERLFYKAAVWKRALVVIAGPAANFLLALVIFWAIMFKGLDIPPAQVGDVIEGSRAQAAGLLPFDVIKEINGTTIQSWSDIERNISKNPESDLTLKVLRDNQEISIMLRPESVSGLSLFGAKAQIGRAGIALAYPSAVMTVRGESSVATKLGLKTGDRVNRFRIDQQGWTKVSGFHHLLKLLRSWRQSSASSIEIEVEHVELVADATSSYKEQTPPQSTRTIQFSTKDWPLLTPSSSDRSYAQSLGIYDSHLTVGFLKALSQKSLKVNDILLGFNGTPIKHIYHLQELINENTKPSAQLRVERDHKQMDISVDLEAYHLQKMEGSTQIYILDCAMLGLTQLPEPWKLQSSSPVGSLMLAMDEAEKQTTMMIQSLWSIISGKTPLKALGGPILIAKVASDSAKAGISSFLITMALISINLGLVNLFPIPVLDGGQLVMLGAEQFKGSPLTEKTIENFQKLGFVAVLSLVVLAMYNDLSRFWVQIIHSFAK
jgi:regulator of sigma E protease